MIGIGELFKRIQNVRAKEILVRTAIADAIKKHVGMEIPLDAITFSSGSVVLKNVNQAARSVIFIKKAAILAEIARSQTIKAVNDIR